jgi:transposase InsO family protein
MMREDNLLCVRRRRFVVTTDSRHSLPIYPNLARQIKPTPINQLWVADITYIRLRTEFRLPGCGAGRILAARDRLGAGTHVGGGVDHDCVAHTGR